MSDGLVAPLLTDADEYDKDSKEKVLMAPLSPTQRGIDKTFDYLFKVILIGDSGVGKTSTLERFVDNTINDRYIQTIGVDFKMKTIFCSNVTVKLQIWDTTGQERFRSITTSYYKGSHIFFIIFDITDIESFKHVSKCINDINQYADHQNIFGKMLIGNKIDMENKRVVEFDKAEQVANNADFKYMESSAKTGYNLESIFKYAAENAVAKKKELDKLLAMEAMEKEESNASFATNVTQKMSGCCCCTVL
eukprot:297814_1